MCCGTMFVLGIETSCDETSAAVVADGRDVRSCVVASQVDLHSPYGGVVPEIACRSHVEALPGIVEDALGNAGLDFDAMDAVAVTYGPGLASSLLVGTAAAKGFALSRGLPLLGVNHLAAHLFSPFLAPDVPPPAALFPFAGLVVSGGHTCLLRVEAWDRMTLVGQTVDDAAGEAFDKGATLLGLGYPGGPAIDRAATGGDPAFVAFPRGRVTSDRFCTGSLRRELCFSFSGLKTSLRQLLEGHPDWKETHTADLAASYREAIVDAIVPRCRRAVEGCRALVCGGGVILNARLRSGLARMAEDAGCRLLLPAPRFCGDNAAMIAGAAGAGLGEEAGLDLDVAPNLAPA